jgi:YfiH family protein
METSAELVAAKLSGPRYLLPDWPAPKNVLAVSTKRDLARSIDDAMAGFNLARHVDDDLQRVEMHRQQLKQDLQLSTEPGWLNQIHTTDVVDLPLPSDSIQPVSADASYTKHAGETCVVMTADCLPVLFCDQAGNQVAAAHAGWRGLLNGVLENTVAKFSADSQIMAWLGPAIGPQAFEVGAEVREAFVAHDAQAAQCFVSVAGKQDKYMADIYQLARQRLQTVGVEQIYGGTECTLTQSKDYFSHRRDPASGRQASLICLMV